MQRVGNLLSFAHLHRPIPLTLAKLLANLRSREKHNALLLARERGSLSALASAAGCELIAPEPGTRCSASSMDKASTVSEPAEEGNVVECLVPGVRLAGTDGALVFPRVVLAAGFHPLGAGEQPPTTDSHASLPA